MRGVTIEQVGFVILVSLPFLLLLGSFWGETGSILAAVCTMAFMLTAFGFIPSLLGYWFWLLAGEASWPWAVLVGIASWPAGMAGFSAAGDYFESRARA